MLWLILAIALWGVLHSLSASGRIKDFCRRVCGDGFMKLYRLFYNIFAAITFLPIMYLMVALPDKILYQVAPPNGHFMRVGQGVALFLLIVAAFQTDLLSFIGLRQLVQEPKSASLTTNGLYRLVRHPLYTFGLLALWLSPRMTLNSFVVYAALTVYILVGIIFEERKLIREFGQDYADYRSVTPMLIPGLNLLWNK